MQGGDYRGRKLVSARLRVNPLVLYLHNSWAIE
jgi:hypothetical protein